MKNPITVSRIKNTIKATLGFPIYVYKGYHRVNVLYDEVLKISQVVRFQNVNFKPKISSQNDAPINFTQNISLDIESANNIQSHALDQKKVKFPAEAHRLSLADNVNVAFRLNNKIYKAVHVNSLDLWLDLEKTALIELHQQQKIPNLYLTNYYTNEFPLIYEVEMLTDTRPNVWSFEALKQAAICTLEVNEILVKHGFQLRDAHPFNILFKGTNTRFIDFGSFCKKNIKEDWHEIVYNEFLKMFVIPLMLANLGEHLLAKSMLYSSYIINTRTLPGQNIMDSKLLKKVVKNVSTIPKNKIKAFIQNLSFPSGITMWQDYAKDFFRAIKENKFHPKYNRFEYIATEIKKLTNCETILDIAGNSGACLFYIKKRNPQIKKSILIDYDEYAINEAFIQLKHCNDIEAYLMNFMFFDGNKNFLKSDITLSLALTHHLILTQGFDIKKIFEKIQEVTGKYALIEFMPWGLWGGGENPIPVVPDWYTVDWFRDNFINYFELVHEKDLGGNRYLFIGRMFEHAPKSQT